jgi:IS30 family transposase
MGTHYSHLTEADRMSIQALLQAKLSCRAIARQLSLNHSSISREINRGKLLPTVQACSYQAGAAHLRCRARRAGAGAGAARRKLGADVQTPLWRMVLSGLRCHWSPEQIAGKLRDMNHAASPVERALPDQPLTVSHETIYCAIYAMPRGTLRAELIELLRKSHKARLPRARGSVRKSRLPNMTSIDLRRRRWLHASSRVIGKAISSRGL